ncbi:hypothetical protein CcaverHIS002_0310460 [Cutaneotrichosporon cavernicola]|uniref:Uncharacterized protein n=1 Tax=Cutaneotrichosporon cavernicola TaxID=279322 RepID=A0AA48IDI3_9TREE|nr:uncharacterized protein CcaverHIS019_0310320 [Cutaneotrichosporon cavernicola]BEI83178.1 hypothetical protein CcaverHIS002_0310460 [Cutaneotrichosporon cavernicola]BEI90962.1 hypothetical protein CcaverHIS019_0310320 [Cutaneotrichosporon cavernicola]BEI98740.1 hypothetical protein CcaverHIS631_0310390 [Cutaneotrichosporon cavernicola]BEJ06512.1 hypothetical protein CcaverHIS641_0310340 [Cutaneotrichosporon cavernicola]
MSFYIGYEAHAALCWALSISLCILAKHHDGIARTIRPMDLYRPLPNLLLLGTLDTLNLGYFLASVLVLVFASLCTFPPVLWYLIPTGIITALGLSRLTSSQLSPLFPAPINVDVLLWDEYGHLPPAHSMNYRGDISSGKILLLRSKGIEPELWSRENSPDPPRVIRAREQKAFDEKRLAASLKWEALKAALRARREREELEYARKKLHAAVKRAAENSERQRVRRELEEQWDMSWEPKRVPRRVRG